jgi:hypothetical protein
MRLCAAGHALLCRPVRPGRRGPVTYVGSGEGRGYADAGNGLFLDPAPGREQGVRWLLGGFCQISRQTGFLGWDVKPSPPRVVSKNGGL